MNNTIKKFSLISMAFVLCVCCIVPSFSWYSHSAVQKDKTAMYYQKANLPVSGYLASDDLSMTTYKGSIDKQGEVTYATTPLKSGTKITAGKSTDGKFNTTCYKTVIENKSKTQEIRTGLYLETAEFGDDNDIYFGTSDPIWRRLSADSMSTVAKPKYASTNTMRVYYQRTYNKSDGKPVWSEKDFYVTAHSNAYNHKVYKMTPIDDDKINYYADIPADSTNFYIACEETESLDYRRTGEIPVVDPENKYKLSSTQSVVVTLKEGQMDNKNMKAFVENTTGANVAKYVSTLFLTTKGKGKTGSVALKKGTDYIGYDTETVSGITYTSEKPSIATVDKKTGTVTGVAEGTAVIDITVKGQYGDTYTVKSVVNVQNPNQTVPLVQNVLVKAEGKAEVCWYIDNKSTTTDLNDIKLMLTL